MFCWPFVSLAPLDIAEHRKAFTPNLFLHRVAFKAAATQTPKTFDATFSNEVTRNMMLFLLHDEDFCGVKK